MKVTKNSLFIRGTFLDYFKNNDHSFIRSSPVVPFCDPTLSFVNAGMNQFKNVLLGHQIAPCPRVVNSQKCIRVGGKHNDLTAVGNDSYHHTFFEMLGNWSFGDYFKKEACKMAWEFLTSPPISILPNHLFITYFNGDEKLGLPPDLETKEIWLSIGVDKDRILPFDMKENFWEMGKTGPCGPCTEIHYDYDGSPPLKRAELVNRGFSDVIELWNIVFIQYDRSEDGILRELPVHHVDTGLGFERFVASLQGKKSNYDTDLFTPLFDTISKVTGAPAYSGKFGLDDKEGLDTAYRILTDHTRMCVVALADNMFPDQNHKLKRVLRKALTVAEKNFKSKKDYKLMQEVANSVCDILSPVYPEISNNIKKIHFIIEQESELIKELKKVTAHEWHAIVKKDNRLSGVFTGSEAAGLPAAYNEIIASYDENNFSKFLKDDIALKLYDTYGLDADLIKDLANTLGLEFSEEGFYNKLSELKKERMKNLNNLMKNSIIEKFVQRLLEKQITITDDHYKYKYERSALDNENYLFPELEANIQSIISLDNINKDSVSGLFFDGSDTILKDGDEIAIVLDKTNFYVEAGGQSGDVGEIHLVDSSDGSVIGFVDVKQVLKSQGFILHVGKFSKGDTAWKSSEHVKFQIGSNNIKSLLKVNKEKRLSNMRNHTATHLINSALRKLLTVTCQKSSFISDDHLIFDFAVYKEKFDKSTVTELERMITEMIQSKLPVYRRIVDSNELLSLNDIILLPGEVYPDSQISLIEIIDKNNNSISKEPCCGTHLFNTGDVDEFCVINLKSKGSNVKSITAVTGENAKIAEKNNRIITESLRQFDEKIRLLKNETNLDDTIINGCSTELQNFKKELLSNKSEFVSYSVLCNAVEIIEDYTRQLKKIARSSVKELLASEMKVVVDNLNSEKYLIHFIQSSSDLDSTSLHKATKMCPTNIPVLLLSYSSDNLLRARCSVPESMADYLSATKWMTSVCEVIGTTESSIRGQDPNLVCGMKPKRIPKNKVNDVINIALSEAKVVVEDSLNSLK